MKPNAVVALALLFVVGIAVLAWHACSVREPSYQGRSLTKWLDEYNRAGAMDKTGPVSEAIRAMGTNSLPFLLTYLRQKDPRWKSELINISHFAQRRGYKGIPGLRRTQYLSPALLALKALGPKARPIIPELLKMFENPNSASEGGLALFSVGPASISAFQEACEHTNSAVRTAAATYLALLPLSYNGDQPYSCIWDDTQRADSHPQAHVFGPGDTYFMVNLSSLARNNPDARVRRASIEALAAYFGKQQNQQPENVVRTFRKARRDPDAHVAQAATEALKSIGRVEPVQNEGN
jgi:hypothetical protein